MQSKLINRIEKLIGAKVIRHNAISGGDISNAIRVETVSGDYFVKQNSDANAQSMFLAEAKGLNLLRNTGTFNIPKVIAVDINFLILEYIPLGHTSNKYWNDAGKSLAQLHKSNSSYFGLDHDNFIGSLPQINDQHKDWATFYPECRLIPQFKMAVESGYFSSSDKLNFKKLIQLLPGILPDESPSMIHGDLWSGNIISDRNQNPIIIDPAVCYAHREMDISMSLLFGGFSQRFYNSYNDSFPLLNDWKDRTQLYQLYYLLVHVNLFGRSYVPSCSQIFKHYS